LEASTTLSEEERRTTGIHTESVTSFGILLESPARRRVNRHQARFSELGLANGQNAVFEINVGPVEGQCLTGTEAGGD
jgi:hypothetical protein